MPNINYSTAIVYGNFNEPAQGNFSSTKNLTYASVFSETDSSSQQLSSINLVQRFINVVSLSGNTNSAAISAAVNGLDGLGYSPNV
jgi:hypothetical protein